MLLHIWVTEILKLIPLMSPVLDGVTRVLVSAKWSVGRSYTEPKTSYQIPHCIKSLKALTKLLCAL